MDINQLLAGLTAGAQQQIGQANAAAAGISADTEAIRKLLTINEQEAAGVASSAATTAAQEAQVGYKAAKAKEANAALAGMNPDDLNNEYVRSLADFNTAEEERKRVRADYDKAATADLFTDPLGYVVGQLRLPTLAAQNNAAVDRRDAAAGNIKARAELIKAKDSIIAANTADTMLQLNLDKAKTAKAVADIQLRQAQADNISKIGARALETYRVSQDVYRIQREVLQTEMSVRQWQAAQEAAAEARRARLEAANARMKEEKLKDEERIQLNARLAAASAALGYQEPFTLTSIRLLPKAKQDLLVQTALAGEFGSNLSEAMATMKAVGNPQVIAQTNAGMGKFMTRVTAGGRFYADQIAREATAKGTKLKAGQAETEGLEQYQVDTLNSAQSFASKAPLNAPRWDDNGVFNPYKPEYLALIDAIDAGKVPGIKPDNAALAAFKTLRTNLAPNATNFAGADMERAVQVVARQVADGKLGADKAAKDIADLHRAGAALNSQLYNYTQFGLPQQTSAIVAVSGIAAFADPQKLDLMDPASVKTALTRMAAQSSALTNVGNPFVMGERGFR